jgi:DMSO/TMAO reductase YedYZ molybdopterin-dependent catalytic subunit
MYGYKSIKWLSTISVVNQVEPGYWEDNGYAVDAWIGRSNGLSGAPIS